MRTELKHTASTRFFCKPSLLMTAATLCVSASFMTVSTPASAFNIDGLIRGAIAHYSGGFRMGGGGGGHHARVHEARRSRHPSREDRDQDADSTPGSTDTPPSSRDNGPSRGVTRANDHVVDSGKVVPATKAYAEEPSFAPSR
jgi:hypothetical protein